MFSGAAFMYKSNTCIACEIFLGTLWIEELYLEFIVDLPPSIA